MADARKLCVLTVHGIGFQQPPDGDTPGYADALHQNLRNNVGELLGSDPDRPAGPVYVRSAKPGTRDKQWGLSRLDGPLTEPGDAQRIAHVALVYSSLEGVDPPAGAGIGAVADAGLTLGHYASVTGAVRLVAGDVWAAVSERSGHGQPSPSLRPRTDQTAAHRGHLARLMHREPSRQGLTGTVRALEDDVVAYVCRNDLRERIREFIAEAVDRLLARADVSGVVVNAHSQGTVASFDVLRQRPHQDTPRLWLVTAGSPLRKYASMFFWGGDAGSIRGITWLNFWDSKDPVADPLDPPADWHFGDPARRAAGQPGLFWAVADGGAQVEVPITDIPVDNLTNSSGGGLQAHNYWDNTDEFISKLADLLKTAHPANP